MADVKKFGHSAPSRVCTQADTAGFCKRIQYLRLIQCVDASPYRPSGTLGEHFLFDILLNTLTPKWNIAPTHSIATLLWNQGKQHYGRMHKALSLAGLKIIQAAKMINARCGAFVKTFISGTLQKQRCLILADGYYEWRRDNPWATCPSSSWSSSINLRRTLGNLVTSQQTV